MKLKSKKEILTEKLKAAFNRIARIEEEVRTGQRDEEDGAHEMGKAISIKNDIWQELETHLGWLGSIA